MKQLRLEAYFFFLALALAGAFFFDELLPGSGSGLGWGDPAFDTVTVVGRTVTLSWAPALAPAGFPVTFYELLLYSQRIGSQPVPTVLLPANATSLSGTVPAGNYLVALVAGNACGKSDTADGIAITVP